MDKNKQEGGTVGIPEQLVSLADLLKSPELLDPPSAVADRIAWEGRTVLLAAREKDGKSTLATAVAAAVSKGGAFLGASALQGRVLYVGLEEHQGDLVRRLVRFEADPDSVFILPRLRQPFKEIESTVTYLKPALVVIDTLAALTSGMRVDSGSSSAWTPIMQRIANIARDGGSAVLILHHGRKSDGTYRDSTAIGAGVDMILEMRTNKNQSVSAISASGRWHIEDFSIRLVDDGEDSNSPALYELHLGEPPLEARIRDLITARPGCTTTDIRSSVRGGNRAITECLERLEVRGLVMNHGDGRSARWHLNNSGAPQDLEEETGPPSQTPTNGSDGRIPEPARGAE